MIYHCDQCGGVLTPGMNDCPACGRRFEHPVPPDAETAATPTDALLRGRTASGAPGGAPAPAPYYQTPTPKGSGRTVWAWIVGSLLVVITLVGVLIWGSYSLWMRGPGGEIAFRQHNYAGNAAFSRGDFAAADAEYSQMIALRPRRVDGYLLRAISELREGQFTAAIDDNTTALGLTRHPLSVGGLLCNRAQARLKKGDLAGAIADYTASNAQYALVRDPRELSLVPDLEADNLRQRADAHWQHKDYALTIADCSAVLRRFQPRPDDYGFRAKAEDALGRDAAEQADFTQALKLDPDYLDGYIGLGKLAEKHHQYAQAVAVYAQATRQEPDIARFWGSLGWCQYEAGQIPQAEASAQHALSLDPNQAWINFNLALCYAVSGDKARAKAAYAEALAHGSPSDQKGALTDIHNALAKQPGSAVLQQAQQQVTRGDTPAERDALLRQPPPFTAVPPAVPRPPSAFAASLGPEVAIGDYGIQPPKGYTLTQRQQETLDRTGTEYLWTGPQRDDGTAPTLQVVISRDDGSAAANYTSIQFTQEVLAEQSDNHTNLTQSPVTACTLGGLPFGHGDWKGVGTRTGKMYEGSEYYSVTPSKIINLSGHDAMPYSQTTLPLIQASILTFRKR